LPRRKIPLEEPDVESVPVRPYAKPEDAAARLLEIAAKIGPNAMGWYYVERINAHFLYTDGGTPAEYGAGIRLLRDRGSIVMHDSGGYFTIPPDGATVPSSAPT
jgi:hypothetical protein